MLSSFFSKEVTVGIDIGSSWIKAVEIEPTPHGWTLVNAAVAPTPKEAIKDGCIINIVDVSQEIRNMLRDAGMKPTGAVCAISGSQVIVRQVQFPKMAEALLRKSIKYEAGKFISSSMEDSIVEFQILGEAEDPAQMNVMLVAAPKDMIDSRVAVLESAGLEPLVIDIESFAVIRALVEFNATDEYLNSTIALIDVGASHTDVDIVSKGEFALTRNIPIAGDSFTNSIRSLLGGSFEDAEQAKRDMTAQLPIDRLNAADTENKCWRVVQPLLDELIREIRRSIHFYQSQFPEGSVDAQVSKIVLTGGTARMPGLSSYISGRLDIPAQVASVFDQTAIKTGSVAQQFIDEHGPVLAVSTGLALKELIPETTSKAVA
ncbi:MAG: type IV pilus assembly protein PilM [Armatimonadota bacterium]